MDEWGIDVVIAGSQKGLMLPPGLSFNGVGPKALEASKTAGIRRSYWDWAEMIAINKTGYFPYTPATNLLFLEKQLTDVKTFVGNLPELDPSESWTFDANASLFKSEPTRSNRTKKVQKAIVLYDATEKHPAQTQLITEDTVVGVYTQTKMSGAVPLPQKRAMLNRIDELLRAVQKAREEANAVVAADQRIGAAVFHFLLNG